MDLTAELSVASNERMQAREIMAQRAARAAGTPDQSPPTASRDSEMGSISFKNLSTGDLHKRIQSLEHEVADQKKLLLDCLYDKQAVEREKGDLQRLVSELSGDAVGGPPVDDESVVTDRAKSTIMQLRMKRVEQKRALFVDVVRQKAAAAAGGVRALRAALHSVRGEFEDQMGRLSMHIVASAEELEGIAEAQARNAVSFDLSDGRSSPSASPGLLQGEASGAGTPGGGYLSMVAAAVQREQKHIVLSQDHPMIAKMGALFDTVDATLTVLNATWQQMRCFQDTVAPSMEIPRRYIDQSVNLVSYTNQMAGIQGMVRHAALVNRLFSDLSFPQLTRECLASVKAGDDELRAKTALFFEAMRLVRTSVTIKTQNLSTAMRIFAAVDAVQGDGAKLSAEYRRLSTEHTARFMKYLAAILRFGRVRARPHEEREGEPALHALPAAPARVGTCGVCACPDVTCEDCFRVQSTADTALRFAFEKRRSLIGDFTLARLAHFAQLGALIDAAVGVLQQARLVPLDVALPQKRRAAAKTRAQAAAAAEAAVETVLRHPKPPSSKEYFTRMRQTRAGREEIVRGLVPELSVSTDSRLNEAQLLRMVEATDLRHFRTARSAVSRGALDIVEQTASMPLTTGETIFQVMTARPVTGGDMTAGGAGLYGDSPRRAPVSGRARLGTPSQPLGRAELEARLPYMGRGGKAEALHVMRADALRAHQSQSK
jgi:hypothetical protein